MGCRPARRSRAGGAPGHGGALGQALRARRRARSSQRSGARRSGARGGPQGGGARAQPRRKPRGAPSARRRQGWARRSPRLDAARAGSGPHRGPPGAPDGEAATDAAQSSTRGARPWRGPRGDRERGPRLAARGAPGRRGEARGVRVRIVSLGQEGEVVGVDGTDALVRAGPLKVRRPVADLSRSPGRRRTPPKLGRSRSEKLAATGPTRGPTRRAEPSGGWTRAACASRS